MSVEKTAALFEINPTLPGFFSSANAFQCACEEDQEPLQYRSSESITNISIIAGSDFDPAHPAGSDVTSNFAGFRNGQFYNVAGYNEAYTPVLYSEADQGFSIDFLLMQPPASGGNYSFIVRVTLSDGRILEQTTTPVKLF